MTLTYAPEHLPEDGSVNPRETQLWMKRLRRMLEKRNGPKVRYFLCGEYGSKSLRPHYHASVFGLSEAEVSLVRASWPKGHVYVAEFNRATAQYVCGYVVKGMTHESDSRLQGLAPEFARMSNRPGIGALAMETLANSLTSRPAWNSSALDVPKSIRLDGKEWPLGRYLRKRLREECGFIEEYQQEIKQAFILEKSAQMSALLRERINAGEADASIARIVREEALPVERSLKSREAIFRRKDTL